MKNTICLGVAVVALGLGACERHDWEETKQLYEHGDGHGKDAAKHAEGGESAEPGKGGEKDH